MNYQDATIFQLAISGAVLCLFLVRPWIGRAATIGLPFCYLVSLAMIHWLGAFIHVLPWDPIRDTYAHRGFREAFFGIVSFAAGSALLAPFILRFVVGERQDRVPMEKARMGDSQLPIRYLLLGTVFYTVLAPA